MPSHFPSGPWTVTVKPFNKVSRIAVAPLQPLSEEKAPSKSYDVIVFAILNGISCGLVSRVEVAKPIDNKFKYKYCYLYSTLMVLFVVALIFYGVVLFFRNVPEKYESEPSRQGKTKIYSITFFGDSLTTKPHHKFNLHRRIRSALKLQRDEYVEFLTFGHNGDSIERLRNKVDQVLAFNASGLILFWDSDFDLTQIKFLRADRAYDIRYSVDLRYVIKRVMDYGTDVITVAGPGTYKEGYFDVLASDVLDKYNKVNENVCAEYSVPYTNFRKALKKDFPWYWLLPRYYSTIDGQHPNRHGADILAGLFAKHINSWLEKERKKSS